MSQQELNFEEVRHDGPQASYSGYEGTPQHRSYSTGFYGEKLSAQRTGQILNAGQRLALAIVSLALLVVVIFGMVLIAVASHADGWVAIPVLLVIFLFGAVVTIINLAFNRSH
jgi:hypothetical protein